MRLLQICTSFGVGGIQRHVMELTGSLRVKGHDVFLAGAPGQWLSETIGVEYLPLDLLAVSGEKGDRLRRAFHASKCACRLRRFIGRHEIELIHAHESAPAIVARLATLGMSIPILLTYHGSAPGRVRSFGRIGRLTAQRIITPSHRCAADLHERAGVPRKVIDVIGLGVQAPPAIGQDRVDRHRTKLLGSRGKLLVVVIARIAHQKGIDVLVEVVRRVKERRDDIRFVVVGDGPLMKEAREWATKAGVETLLRFDGVSDEPYLYLKAADVFLLTSRWEGLPITIAEAFQAGLPVVATDAGGVEELVAPPVGRVLPIGDAEGLSASVLEICGDDQLRRDMSEAAMTVSREDRFSIPHIHRIIERTYMDVLDGETTQSR